MLAICGLCARAHRVSQIYCTTY